VKKFTISRLLPIALLAPLLTACPDIPEECGMNVDRVTRLSFSGPSVIPPAPDQEDFAGYDVSVTVEKDTPGSEAIVCYAVRDDDPITKLFWAVDDVLDSNFIYLEPEQTSRTLEGNFVLVARHDEEVCGGGALSPENAGCSGEEEAEVYLQPIGSDGVETSRRSIRCCD